MEETNREIKIAIVVGLILVTCCIVAFIVTKSKNNPDVTMDIKVYKHIATDEDGHGTYYECNIATDNLTQINTEFKRIMNLKDNLKVTSYSTNINGDYKIVSGSNFIAFDGDDSYVYRSDTTAIYDYSSEMYQKVVDYCANITEESVKAAEEETADEADTEEETTTKKSSSSSKTTSSSTKTTSSTKKSTTTTTKK